MKSPTLYLPFLAAGLLFSTVLMAAPRGAHPGFDREHRQARIEQGVRRGQLLPWEVQRLHLQQRQLALTERHYRADGRLNRFERRDLALLAARFDRELRHLIFNDAHRGRSHYDLGRRYRGPVFGYHPQARRSFDDVSRSRRSAGDRFSTSW